MFNTVTMKTGILALVLLASTFGYSQHEEAMHLACNELNGIYAGTYRFHVNGEGQLEVEFYNEDGNFRQDMVYIDFLSPEKITYNAEEQAVSIRCAEKGEKCIDKEIFKLDVVRQSSRINIKQADAGEAAKTIDLLIGLVESHRAFEEEMSDRKGELKRGKGETRRRR